MIKNVMEHIKARRSVRTYDKRILDERIKADLLNFMQKIDNPFGIPVECKFLNGKENGLSCPVMTGTDLYVGGKIKNVPNASAAFGYSFELFVLYAQSLGLGTVWLGGTMNREAFEAAMHMEADEIMPCASPVGYTAKKMSVRESVMRKAIKADERFPFADLFFDGAFDTPLSAEKAGKVATPLEMVRLAPSAVNKQPWRVVIKDNAAHFYLKRTKGYNYSDKLDMQMIDVGIALCHFELAAKECGLNVAFQQEDPQLSQGVEVQYIASYYWDTPEN